MSIIKYNKINVKEIFENGKNFPWKKPQNCPQCGSSTLWGHGFVERYFAGINGIVYLKRYRCPCCRAVHVCYPGGYWRGFSYSLTIIIKCILKKIKYQKWLSDISREIQYYWYKGFLFQMKRSENFLKPTKKIFIDLIRDKIIPVTHSIKNRFV